MKLARQGDPCALSCQFRNEESDSALLSIAAQIVSRNEERRFAGNRREQSRKRSLIGRVEAAEVRGEAN